MLRNDDVSGDRSNISREHQISRERQIRRARLDELVRLRAEVEASGFTFRPEPMTPRPAPRDTISGDETGGRDEPLKRLLKALQDTRNG